MAADKEPIPQRAQTTANLSGRCIPDGVLVATGGQLDASGTFGVQSDSKQACSMLDFQHARIKPPCAVSSTFEEDQQVIPDKERHGSIILED